MESYKEESQVDTPKEIIDDIVSSGLRQTDICRQTGLSPAFVCELRSGKRKNISYLRMAKLVDLHRKVMRSVARKNRKQVAQA